MDNRLFSTVFVFVFAISLSFNIPAYSFTLKSTSEEKPGMHNQLSAKHTFPRTGRTFAFGAAISRKSMFSRKAKRAEKTMTVKGDRFKYLATGMLSGGSKMTVIFLHGRGGSRHLGFSNQRFDGNFKQLKDLMYANEGIYISTDVTNFGDRGERNIGALVSQYRKKTKGKLVVACGSMGSFICWKLAKNKKLAAKIDSYIFLGGFPDPEYLASGKLALITGKPSFYFSHGSRDRVYNWRYASRYSRALRRTQPRYPVKLSIIKGGDHGAPIRQINWKKALNWVAKQK